MVLLSSRMNDLMFRGMYTFKASIPISLCTHGVSCMRKPVTQAQLKQNAAMHK